MKSRPRSRILGLIWIVVTASVLFSGELYGGSRDPAEGPIDESAATAVGRDRPCADAAIRDPRISAKVGDWALVWGRWEAGGWADILESPDQEAHRRAQALLGDRVKVLGQRGDWMKVIELKGSWRGWIQAAHLTYGSSRVRRTFAKKRPTVAFAISPYLAIDGCGSLVPYGAQLPVADGSKERLEVQLPDGRRLDVKRSQVALTDQPKPISFALANVDGLLRRPFQTGGNSPASVDGAGLVYLILRASGYGGVPREPAALWGRATPVSSRAMEPGDVLLLDTFSGQAPSPALLVTDRTLLEASPASGVNFLPLDDLTRSRLREVRRFPGTSSHATWTRLGRALRATPSHERDLLLLFVVLTSQNTALAALLLLAFHRGIGNSD